jgi:RsiW-degrading membrane proteinase PrsW (M82 family)
MIEAVYVGTLAPLLFLLLVLKEENRRLILFLLWGLTAALAAYYLNAILRDALRISTEEESRRVAPVVEELLKAAPLFLYLFSRKSDRSYEAVRNGLAVGIGFSILENVAYLTVSAPHGLRSVFGFIVLRSLSACLFHGAATALTGYVVRQMRLYRLGSPLLALGVLATAIMSHGIFNAIASIPSAWFACVLVPAALFAIELWTWNIFGRKSSSLPPSIAEGAMK